MLESNILRVQIGDNIKIYVINLLNLQCLRQYLNESKSVGQTEISQKYSN